VSQFDEGQAFDRLINAPKAKIGVACVDDAVSKIRKMKVARVVEWQTRQASDSKNGHFRASKNTAQHTQKRLSKNNLRLVKFNTRL
jgi:hypothetical protein